MTEKDRRSEELGRLFERVTGETEIRLDQEDAGHPSGGDDDLPGYKRRHDEVSRHESLRDAIDPPTVES